MVMYINKKDLINGINNCEHLDKNKIKSDEKVMMNMTKITFNVEELGEKIVESIGIDKNVDNIIPSDVIWDSIFEELNEFEYVIFDEVASQLKEQDIEIGHW